MIPVARLARRSASNQSSVRAAAAAMVESLELRRLLSYSVTEVVDSQPEPGTNFGAGIASNGNLALVPNALGANFDGKVLLIDTTDGSVERTFESPAPNSGGTFGSGVAWVGNKIIIGASGIDRIFVYDNAADLDPDVIENPNGGFATGFGVAMAAIDGDLLASNINGDGEVLRFDLDLLDGNSNTTENPQDLLIATYSYDNITFEPDLTQLGTAIVTHNAKIYAAAKDQTGVGYVVEFDALGDADAGTYARLIEDTAVTPAQGSVPFGSDLAIAGNNLLVGAKDANALYEVNLTTLASVAYEVPQGTDAGLGLGISVNGSQVALGNLAFSGASVLIYDWATRTHLETISNPPETGTATNDFDNFGMFINALPDGGYLVADNSDDLDADNWDTGAVYIFKPEGGPTNEAPTADAGASQSTTENGSVTLDAGGSTDPDGPGDITEYAWDLDNNGSYETVGITAPFSQDLPGNYTVGLRVTDSANNTSTDTVIVTFSDDAPIANAGPDQTNIVTNQTVTFVGSGNNAAGDTIASYAWDLDNDGAFDDATGATASKAFETTGLKTVRLQVTDDDGQTAVDTLTVNVAASAVVGGVLYLGGTGDADAVAIQKGGTLIVNGVPAAYPGTRIVIFGGAGDDTITVSPSATVAVEIHGGAGADSLSGGSLDDVIIGDGGDDVIYGGAGRDLLIGGSGADVIVGEVNDDILVAGSTRHDNDSLALKAIMDEWTSANPFATRVANLGTMLAADFDVFNDSDVDTLTGKNGDDWFFVNNADGGVQDVITDLKNDEVATDLDFVPTV